MPDLLAQGRRSGRDRARWCEWRCSTKNSQALNGFDHGKEQSQAAGIPEHSLPLWVQNSYRMEIPVESLPCVAVKLVDFAELKLVFPLRPRWLTKQLGDVPKVPRIYHECGEYITLTPRLEKVLFQAAELELSIELPPEVRRFLARLAYRLVDNAEEDLDSSPMFILEHPGGDIITAQSIQKTEYGVKYE